MKARIKTTVLQFMVNGAAVYDGRSLTGHNPLFFVQKL